MRGPIHPVPSMSHGNKMPCPLSSNQCPILSNVHAPTNETMIFPRLQISYRNDECSGCSKCSPLPYRSPIQGPHAGRVLYYILWTESMTKNLELYFEFDRNHVGCYGWSELREGGSSSRILNLFNLFIVCSMGKLP